MSYDSISKAYIKLFESTNHPMIEVDGDMKHRHNSLGQPIHHTDEGIKNFHRWFGNDSNVDEHGRPKVLFHSTLSDTEKFNPVGKFMGYTGTTGISLTDNPEMASRYLERYASHGYVDGVPNQPFEKNVMPVYAKLGKVIERDEPFKVDIGLGFPLPKDYIPIHKKMGFDTLIRNDDISKKGAVKHSTAKNAIRGKEYVLTSPSQIKSAIGNSGKFSSESEHLAEAWNDIYR